jgi:hypothetical protein
LEDLKNRVRHSNIIARNRAVPRYDLSMRFTAFAVASLGILLPLSISPHADATVAAGVNPYVSAHAPDTTGADSPESKRTMILLQTIIIPKVNFDWLGIAAVIDFFTIKSKELDPKHVGIRFRLPHSSSSKPTHFKRQVSITLEEVPLIELLGFTIVQTNLNYKIVKGVVILVPTVPNN